MKSKYSLKELGEVERYTNYQIIRNRSKKEVILHQHDFIAELLQLTGLSTCNPSKSKGDVFGVGLTACRDDEISWDIHDGIAYRSVTGALIHLSCHSRPDIAFEVATLCKYNSRPGAQHWAALKQLLRYLKYTANDGLVLGGTSELKLHAYADSGFASDMNLGTSPGGFVFYLGTSVICHKSKWFKAIYTSSTETEMASLYLSVTMAVWLKKLLSSFGVLIDYSIVIREDNQGAIKYSHTKECAGRMKHIDVKFHWIREKINDQTIMIEYVPSQENVADIMTKTLKGSKLADFRTALCLKSIPSIA